MQIMHRVDLVGGSNNFVVVDLVGRYLNQTELLKRLKTLQTMLALQAEPHASVKTPRIHKIEQRLGAGMLDKIAAEYINGVSTPELMAIYKIGKGTVLNILKSRSIALRNQGLTAAQVERAAKLYLDGMSLKQVGAEFKVDAETVRQALKAKGVAMRRPWER